MKLFKDQFRQQNLINNDNPNKTREIEQLVKMERRNARRSMSAKKKKKEHACKKKTIYILIVDQAALIQTTRPDQHRLATLLKMHRDQHQQRWLDQSQQNQRYPQLTTTLATKNPQWITKRKRIREKPTSK